MPWGQAMANLSDLLAGAGAPAASPGWIAALAPKAEFRALEHDRGAPLPGSQPAPAPADPGEAALADAYARGLAEGIAHAAADAAQERAALGQLSLNFSRLDAEAASAIGQHLTHAVAALCEQIIEPALIDRAMLARRCSVLAAQLGAGATACALHLHPDDVALLAEDVVAGWTIRPQPDLPRGSLRLEGPDGVIADGPDEWRRAIAAALGA